MKAKKRKSLPGLIIFMIILILLTAALLFGVINARTVRVVYGTCAMTNLDERLNGLKILYVSDLKIADDSDAQHALKLMERLSQLEPDLILIGGDISGKSFVSGLRERLGISNPGDTAQATLAARDKFLTGMNELDVKYGSLAERERYKTHFLYNETAYVNIAGAFLPIYGGDTFNLNKDGAAAMIVMFHDPSLYSTATLATSKRSGGPQSYLLLSAHALGGQIHIGDYFAFYADINRDYTAKADQNGLFADGTRIKMLLSRGIGTEGLPLRYGTAPTAYLITLKCA